MGWQAFDTWEIKTREQKRLRGILRKAAGMWVHRETSRAFNRWLEMVW